MTTGRINQVARRYPRGCGARAFREKGRHPDRADPRTSPTSRSPWRTLPPFVRRGGRAGRAVFAAHSHLRCQGEATHRATRKDRLADWCFSGRKQCDFVALPACQAQESRCVRQGARCESDTPRRGASERRWHAPCARQATLLAPRHASTRINKRPIAQRTAAHSVASAPKRRRTAEALRAPCDARAGCCGKAPRTPAVQPRHLRAPLRPQARSHASGGGHCARLALRGVAHTYVLAQRGTIQSSRTAH